MSSKKTNLLMAPTGDHPFAALLLLLAGVIILALQDSLIKFIANDTSFWQLQTLRSTGNMLLIICLAMMGSGIHLIYPKRRLAVAMRSLVMVVCMFCFFSGSPFLSVAQMAAGLYTYPLFVSLLAAPLLGESIGKWRISALVIGAAGACIMLDPLAKSFSPVQLLPIVAGFFYACNIIILRRYCRTETPLALTFANGVMFFVSGLLGIIILSFLPLSQEIQRSMPFVAIGWPAIGLSIIGFTALCSVLNLFGNLGLTRAYQTADSSWLAPLDFSYLLFAAIWGKVIFDVWPTINGWVGMILITSAGMITAWREHKQQKQTTAS
ncbi:DMT family transporter [Alphaproteobacteria bacterium]|nr:DMT family transporter [Alphaproteobacteria bacterium]